MKKEKKRCATGSTYVRTFVFLARIPTHILNQDMAGGQAACSGTIPSLPLLPAPSPLRADDDDGGRRCAPLRQVRREGETVCGGGDRRQRMRMRRCYSLSPPPPGAWRWLDFFLSWFVVDEFVIDDFFRWICDDFFWMIWVWSNLTRGMQATKKQWKKKGTKMPRGATIFSLSR